MNFKTIATLSAAVAAIGLASPAAAQGGCDREGLQALADKYVAAQGTGEGFKVPMGEWVQYYENFELSSMSFGSLLAEPHEVDWSRALLDTQRCLIFVEGIVDDAESPWVFGTKISSRGGLVSRYDVVTSTTDDWLFDAARTLRYAKTEDWSPVPEAKRASREEIVAAANAYLDYFKDKSVTVPWGSPCQRLEGAMLVGEGNDPMSCDIGVPDGVDLVQRDYIVDDVLGAVAVMLRFGGPEGLPDVHIFRVTKDGITNIHTITNCQGVKNCGFPPMDAPGN